MAFTGPAAINFLKQNPAFAKTVKDTKAIENEGRAQLESSFPKIVTNSKNIKCEVVYVEFEGKRYAVIATPTYQQTKQGGPFEFVSMTCRVVPAQTGDVKDLGNPVIIAVLGEPKNNPEKIMNLKKPNINEGDFSNLPRVNLGEPKNNSEKIMNLKKPNI